MSNTLQLLQPFVSEALSVRNRVVMAPMTRARAGTERIPNEMMAEYYQQRASAGLIVTEATTISSQANGWNESPGIYQEEMALGWQRTVDAVHAAGGTIFLQLWHCGRASHSSFHHGEPPVAPSPIKLNGESIHTPNGKESYETPRALRTEELPDVVNDYRLASQRANDVGFDGVEIHSANGYLLDEFLQSKTNHRNDDYGGSKENRFRLLREVVEATIDAIGANRVGVRLSPNGAFNDMGSPDYRDQFSYAGEQLDQLSLAYLHVMDGLAFGFHELGPPMTLADFRELFHGPLIGNCGYTRDTAEAAVAGGDADMIAFGRPYISNPDLVDRFAHGWPLQEDADMSVWYSPTGKSGYTDFPSFSPSAP